MKSLTKSLVATSVFAAFTTMPCAQASTVEKMVNAVKDSKTSVNLRYRIESVDQDGVAENAFASTLKSRLTWTSGQVNHFKVKVEIDDVTSIGSDSFNSTANGKGTYPVVADPEGTDVNQANISYHKDNLQVTAGRQRILHNGQRFVGGVGWRQNEQTFDGYRFQYAANENLSFDYSYVFNVNRIFGPSGDRSDLEGNLHLANAQYALKEGHKLAFYGYSLDFETAHALSSNTIGVDYTGKFGGLTAKFSFASQTDTGDNPNDYSTNYYNIELGGALGKLNMTVGIESLGSDNGIGFTTPLATLHKFQGFADKFLGTPGTGINDVYVKASTKFGGVALTAFFHDFSSDVGNLDLGSEFDLVASYKFSGNVSGVLKYAAYNADVHASDTDKLWAMVNVKF